VILAGWVNRQQPQVIEYLRTENQVLKEKLGPKHRCGEPPGLILTIITPSVIIRGSITTSLSRARRLAILLARSPAVSGLENYSGTTTVQRPERGVMFGWLKRRLLA
jgi:hypothetical protein